MTKYFKRGKIRITERGIIRYYPTAPSGQEFKNTLFRVHEDKLLIMNQKTREEEQIARVIRTPSGVLIVVFFL